MTLEVRLRLSIIQAELLRIAETAPPTVARLVRHAAQVLNLTAPVKKDP